MTTIIALLFTPLVNGLGSDDFETRERCQRVLDRVSWLARPALERGRRSHDPEVVFRCELALERVWLYEQRAATEIFRQPGWCDEETAREWVRSGRYVYLPVAGQIAGLWDHGEYRPWPSHDGTMSRVEQVMALVNWGRSVHRQDGLLGSATPWLGCAYPDHPPTYWERLERGFVRAWR